MHPSRSQAAPGGARANPTRTIRSSATLPPRPTAVAGLILAATLLRLLPHPWNLTPMGALALFGGARLQPTRWAFGLPLAAMAVSDAARWWLTGTGWHALSPAVYGAFALVVLLGRALRCRGGAWPVAGGALGGALIFYLVTNFAVWAQLGTYPPTWAGLVACYVAGLPLLGHTAVGNLLYAGVLFGGLALLERRWPRLAAGAAGAAAVALLALPADLRAQDGETEEAEAPAVVESAPVVVTATRVETPAAEVGSSVTVISGEEVERRQSRSVADVLRGVPGLDVVRSGGPGRLSSVFLRGAESDHTLVLVDGIVVNDPMFNRAVDFADLAALNVERIEILRGPQSTLYGSNAIGGVIHIITRRGAGPPRVSASAEAGSFETFNADAAVSGGGETVQYSVAAARQSTAGISAASEDRGNPERDGFESNTVSARLGYTPLETLAFDLTLRATDSEQELDEDFGTGIEDDPNFDGELTQRHARLQGTLDLFERVWSQTLGYARSTHERRSTNRADPAHPDNTSRSVTESELTTADWQHTLRLHESNTLVLGLVRQEETGRSTFESTSAFGPFESSIPETSIRTDSVYAEDRISLAEAFFLTLGVRVDDHETFGEEQTERATVAVLLPSDTTLRASYGTGFKAPTLFDLLSPEFGNPDLEPERSVGWDAGVEQRLADGALVLGITYFRNTYENLISFDAVTFRSVNVAEAESYGTELTLEATPTETLRLSAAATRTETEDKSTGNRLLRRPRDKASLAADWQVTDPLSLRLDVRHVGERDDTDFSTFPAERVTLNPYSLVDVAGAFALTDWLRVFARVENALDEDYEEARGFGTPGRAGYAGARVTF